MKKRFLSAFLALALCMGLAVPAFAADSDAAVSGTCGESTTWSFDRATGTLTIGGTGATNGWGGDPRRDPVCPWQGLKQEIRSVVIEEGVTYIGMSAFEGCANLTQASIPQSVTGVGLAAFSGTPWLESQGEFAIVNGVLLKYQGSAEKVVIPDGVTYVNPAAFAQNKTLTEAVIPEGVTVLADSAFDSCANLAQITFPGTLREVGAYCFSYTKWLENQRAAGDFILAGPVLLKYQGEGGSVVIPDGVAYVEEAAFTWSSWFPFAEDLKLDTLTVPTSMRDLNADLAFFISTPKSVSYQGTRDQWDMVENTTWHDGVQVPVYCAGEEVPGEVPGETTAFTVSVSNPDGGIPPMDNAEFTLRNITEEFFSGNRVSEIHTDLTRDEETETVELDNLPTLTVKGVINICGIQTVSAAQEPWTQINLYAWSDPDGDGVYDQQLFSFYPSTDSVNMVPLSNPGPFSYGMIDYTDGGPIYSRFINFNTDGMPTSNPYSAGDIPSSIILSGNYLTWLFGPNTLVQIQAATAGEYQDGSLVREESAPFYAYIPKDAAAAPAFNDVPVWFREAVNWAAENGVTTGTSYYKFSPDKDCTQAQILTFLWRAAQEPRADTPCPVTLPASLNYAESALAWAAEKGMIDGSLDPKAPCTRAQAVSYIWQALGKEEAQVGSFPDVDAGADYAAAVAWAVENGVTNGFDSGDGTFQFRPGKVCSRGEIAAFLHRAYVPEAKLNAR